MGEHYNEEFEAWWSHINLGPEAISVELAKEQAAAAWRMGREAGEAMSHPSGMPDVKLDITTEYVEAEPKKLKVYRLASDDSGSFADWLDKVLDEAIPENHEEYMKNQLADRVFEVLYDRVVATWPALREPPVRSQLRACEVCHGPGPALWADDGPNTQRYCCVKCHPTPEDSFFHRAGENLRAVIEAPVSLEYPNPRGLGVIDGKSLEDRAREVFSQTLEAEEDVGDV